VGFTGSTTVTISTSYTIVLTDVKPVTVISATVPSVKISDSGNQNVTAQKDTMIMVITPNVKFVKTIV
jgi:hypothetical protein